MSFFNEGEIRYNTIHGLYKMPGWGEQKRINSTIASLSSLSTSIEFDVGGNTPFFVKSWHNLPSLAKHAHFFLPLLLYLIWNTTLQGFCSLWVFNYERTSLQGKRLQLPGLDALHCLAWISLSPWHWKSAAQNNLLWCPVLAKKLCDKQAFNPVFPHFY